jgi:hypothetical protein
VVMWCESGNSVCMAAHSGGDHGNCVSDMTGWGLLMPAVRDDGRTESVRRSLLSLLAVTITAATAQLPAVHPRVRGGLR